MKIERNGKGPKSIRVLPYGSEYKNISVPVEKKKIHPHEKSDLELFWETKRRIARGENEKDEKRKLVQKHKGTTLWFRV